MQPVHTGQLVQQVGHAAALLLEDAGQHRQPHGRGDPVLVPHGVGVHAVAQGLLVAEDEARDPRDPLEAGEGLTVVQAVGLGDTPQEAGGDHRGRQHPRPGEGSQFRGLLPQQGPDLVTGELAPPPGGVPVRHGGRTAVGVGVVGNDQVRPHRAGQVQGQVHGPGLLRVGKGQGREVGVGQLLLGHRDDVGEPGPGQGLAAHLAAHAVHRGQDDGEGGARPHAPGA